MNYVRHLNAFFTIIKDNKAISASHISLYMALFQYWNFNRFLNPFPIYRENIMQMSRISKNTYHKCMRELHQQQFIIQHVPLSKFHMMRITVVPLYQEKETKSRYSQLMLFSPGQLEMTSGSKLSQQWLNIDPGSGSNLSHYIKLNIKENYVLHSPTLKKIENDGYEENPGSTAGSPVFHKRSTEQGGGCPIPTLTEVEDFYKENKYPIEEAKKFFLYNQGKDWMFTDRIPIKQWKSLAHKWMLNPIFSKGIPQEGDSTKSSQSFNHKNHSSDFRGEVQSLYSQHLSGKNISKFILPRHSDELQLTLTEEILNLAKQRRINQLSGSNERSELDLLHAYTSNENHQLLAKDRSNLISLAKRLATLHHFETLKSKGKTTLFSNEPLTTNRQQQTINHKP
jgi:hypothetical protein